MLELDLVPTFILYLKRNLPELRVVLFHCIEAEYHQAREFSILDCVLNQVLNNLFEEQLWELIEKCSEFGVKTLIGSSGSFDSFIEMIWIAKGQSKLASSVRREEFNLDEVKSLHNRLIENGYDSRKAIPGLVEMRVDTIHLASHMVQWVLNHCDLERLLLSSYALKEGVLHRLIDNRI